MIHFNALAVGSADKVVNRLDDRLQAAYETDPAAYQRKLHAGWALAAGAVASVALVAVARAADYAQAKNIFKN